MCVGDLATVVAVDHAQGTARVSTDGPERTVSLAVQPGVRVGDRVVVHTGFVVDVITDAAGGEPTEGTHRQGEA